MINDACPCEEREFDRKRDESECDALRTELAAALADAERYKAEHIGACELVARMHEAAIGEVAGPRVGVVEDVANLRAEREAAVQRAERAVADLDWMKRFSDLQARVLELEPITATAERTAVVVWLRDRAWRQSGHGRAIAGARSGVLDEAAAAIERGDHLAGGGQ